MASDGQVDIQQVCQLKSALPILQISSPIITSTVLLHASGHFSHEFGHHASREANVTWQKLAAANSMYSLAQLSAHRAIKHSQDMRNA